MTVDRSPSRPGIRESLAELVVREGEVLRCTLPLAGPRRTVLAMLEDNTARLPDHPAYLEKHEGRYVPTSWREFQRSAHAFLLFLAEAGIAPGDRVAVLARNRGEMLVAETATMGLGAVYTPIFAGYSAAQVGGLLAQCGAAALLVAEPALLEGMRLPEELRLVVQFSDGGDTAPAPPGSRARPVGFTQALAPGLALAETELEDRVAALAATDPDQPCLMMFTSGTSGEQKGVLLTHENILSQQRALAQIWELGPQDRMLCYLPWHHSFGGIFEKYTALTHAIPLAIDASGGKDFDQLLENWKQVRPTLYFSVPLVHQQLVSHARTHPEQEGAIFHDELKFVFTAAAPLPSNISDYFARRRIAVVEGWGLTETAPCCTLTDPYDPERRPGVVGYPIPGVEVRLDGDGEILVRGPNVMPGYFSNDEANARAFPGDGWFHTGDLGEIEGAALKLLSRKDRVFKMLNAEKVVPTLMENRLAGRNKYIRHVIVVGSGRRELAALVFPNLFLIEQEFGEDRLAAERTVLESFRATIEELNAENPVKYERIRAFAVVDRELTVENGELTPSMKVRVQNVLGASESYVDAIYDPLQDCDCSFLRKITRLGPEERLCPRGKGITLDRCHECGPALFGATVRSQPPAP